MFGAVVPLLDGSRTGGDLVRDLAGSFAAEEVWYALFALERRGCLSEASVIAEPDATLDRLHPLLGPPPAIVNTLRSVPGGVVQSAAYEGLVNCGSRSLMARGKGLTDAQAILSCLAEAAERYCVIASGVEDSNGCAAGNSIEEATQRGLLELIERDAASRWWHEQIQKNAVDLETFGDPFLSRAAASVCVLDLTTELGVPVFAAVAPGANGSALLGLGADVEARIGIRRAILELNQVAGAVKELPARYDVHPQLTPAGPYKTASDYRDRASLKGFEIVVEDLTRPEIGFPVVRVAMDGLRTLTGLNGERFPL